MAKATIIQTTENGQPKMYAQFTEGSHQWNAAVAYPWLFTKGEQVNVMYEKSNMANAKVFSFLGYWITIGELVGSVILWVVLFRVAIAVTKNPTPEGLISEIETGYSGKRKYDD